MNELSAFTLFTKHDNDDSSPSLPSFASKKYNKYCYGKEGGYLLTEDGRHLFTGDVCS